MKGLLRSRKFWLAVAGITQSIVLHYLTVPAEIWAAIDALIAVLIHSIAVEDAAAKSAAPQLTGTISPAGKIEAEKQAGLVPPASEGEKERGD